MVVLEALAHGLPVVCTDLGGPGAIVNERCGRVVRTAGRTRDEIVAELCRNLLELSCDRVLVNKLSHAARKRAWQFDFHKVVTQLHPVTMTEARP
jgi:glycosyltransferase involved in cell wall biosynthesis